MFNECTNQNFVAHSSRRARYQVDNDETDNHGDAEACAKDETSIICDTQFLWRGSKDMVDERMSFLKLPVTTVATR